ncbi:phospholipase-like protein [Tanacetum coccineum]
MTCRREEFCLITGLRFGPEFRERYEVGLIPFRRLLFDSDTNGEEFDNLHDEDVVSVFIVLFIFKGARPNRRLRLDAFEAKAEWDNQIQNRWKFVNTIGYPTLILTFFKTRRTPTYPKTFEEPIPSWHPTSYPDTPHIATPMALQGFAPWSSTNQARPSQNPGTQHIATPLAQQGFAPWSSTNQAGPSQNPDVGGVNPDEMRRGKRETFPSKYQLSLFTCMPTTTVAPKKGANNIRNTTRNAKVSPFNLGKASIDLNSPVRELMYMGSRATNDYISLHNVDPNKVVRNKYVNCIRFLESPESVFLDCFIKGFLVEVQFWQDLVPYVCKGALYTENNPDRFGWLSEDHINCWMELMIRARPPSAQYTVAKTGTLAMLNMSNKFVIETDFHLMGMLDGSLHPYPSWDDVDIVYMPINCGRNHWVIGILNLRWSKIHVIDSLPSPHQISSLINHISKWTNVLNVLLDKAGHFERTRR